RVLRVQVDRERRHGENGAAGRHRGAKERMQALSGHWKPPGRKGTNDLRGRAAARVSSRRVAWVRSEASAPFWHTRQYAWAHVARAVARRLHTMHGDVSVTLSS